MSSASKIGRKVSVIPSLHYYVASFACMLRIRPSQSPSFNTSPLSVWGLTRWLLITTSTSRSARGDSEHIPEPRGRDRLCLLMKPRHSGHRRAQVSFVFFFLLLRVWQSPSCTWMSISHLPPPTVCNWASTSVSQSRENWWGWVAASITHHRFPAGVY